MFHTPDYNANIRQVLIDPAAAIFDVYPALITTKYYSAQVRANVNVT